MSDTHHASPALISVFFFWNNCIYLFIFGCAGFSLLHGLFCSCGEQGLLSSCGVWASYCGGFSCHGAWAQRHGLQSLSSYSTWPQLLPFSSSRAQTQQLWYTRLCCSVAHGILLDQGWNSHLLHWQADSVTELPGKPHCFLLRLQFYFIFSPGIPCRANLDKHSK